MRSNVVSSEMLLLSCVPSLAPRGVAKPEPTQAQARATLECAQAICYSIQYNVEMELNLKVHLQSQN